MCFAPGSYPNAAHNWSQAILVIEAKTAQVAQLQDCITAYNMEAKE